MGHSITLVSLYKTIKEKKQLEELEKNWFRVFSMYQPVWRSILCCLFSLFLPIPLRVAFCFSPYLNILLQKIDKTNIFDIVYIKRLRMAQYRKAFKKNKFIIVDITDSMTKYFDNLLKVTPLSLKKILYFEEYYKHKLYEIKIVNEHDKIAICSHSDKRYLSDLWWNESHIFVLENGIDSNSRTFSYNWIQNRKSLNILFWWVMNVDTNIYSVRYFILNIMLFLDNKYTFTVIWPNPPKTLTDLANPNIFFLWHVDNIQQEIIKYDVFVCPIIAWAWTKNKIIQASCLWIPIISTELWLDWIPDHIKNWIKVFDSPQTFLNNINQLEIKTNQEIIKSTFMLHQKVVFHYEITNLLEKFIFDIKLWNE